MSEETQTQQELMEEATGMSGNKVLVRNGSTFFLERIPVPAKLAPKNYLVLKSDLIGFYLEETAPFDEPVKIYGNVQATVDRYLYAFNDRQGSTGVFLAGTKGSGKTLTAQQVCKKSGLPVLIVNKPYGGDSFNIFLSELPGEFVVFFDEFEKVYHEHNMQELLLTLFDGNFKRKRLFILTSNKEDISYYLRNRPGRIFYKKIFRTLDSEAVNEYISEKLVNQDHSNELKNILKVMDCATMDIMSCIVEEMNRFNEPAREVAAHMNIELQSDSRFEMTLTIKGEAGSSYKVTNSINHPYSNEEIGAYVDFYELADGVIVDPAKYNQLILDKKVSDDDKDIDNYDTHIRIKASNLKFDLDTDAFTWDGMLLIQDVEFKAFVEIKKKKMWAYTL